MARAPKPKKPATASVTGRARAKRVVAKKPARRRKKRLRKHVHVRVAAAQATSGCIKAVLSAWTRVAPDVQQETVHEFRVALRTLRVVLHIFRTVIPSGQADELRQALRKLAEDAGHLRDLDVLIDDIVTPLRKSAGPAGVSALLAALQRERTVARHEFASIVENEPARDLRQRLVDFDQQWCRATEVPDHGPRVGRFARRDLRRRWRRLAKRASAVAGRNPQTLHEMRKALKKLRYAFEYFAPLWPKRQRKPFLRRMQRLQSQLGYANDVRNAGKLAERSDMANAAVGFTVGFVLGTHNERLERTRTLIAKNWKQLAATDVARSLAKR